MRYILAFGLTAIYLGGCTTIVRGTHEDFKVATDPPGASVTTTLEIPFSQEARKTNPGLPQRTFGCPETPCEINVPRRSTFIAKVEKPGYQTVRIIVRPSGTKKVALNDMQKRESGNVAPYPVAGVGGTAAGAAYVVGSSAAYVGKDALTGLTMTTGSAIGLVYAPPFIAADAISGSMLNLYPNPVALKLVPEGEPVPEGYDMHIVEDSRALLLDLDQQP